VVWFYMSPDASLRSEVIISSLLAPLGLTDGNAISIQRSSCTFWEPLPPPLSRFVPCHGPPPSACGYGITHHVVHAFACALVCVA
jgi:hypothetical protein